MIIYGRMLCTENNFGNDGLKSKELLERIIGDFTSIMSLSLDREKF